MENNEQNNQIIIYQADDGTPGIDVRFQGETAWLTQAQLVNLFGSSKANISEHIKHIFEERELERDSVVRKFRTTAADGKISHEKATEKAALEYRQYKAKNLSEVEKAYLDAIKAVQKKIEGKTPKGKKKGKQNNG